MKTVKEVSQLTGVSVRTLHYYDEIGLLRPSQVTASLYRLYDDKALMRLQDILLFRELELPLKTIAELLDGPPAVKRAVLREYVHLLELKRERLDKLLSLTKDLIKGEGTMTLDIFNQEELKQLQEEAQNRWGNTQAYQDFVAKTAADDWQTSHHELMTIFEEFGKLRHLTVTAPAVQEQVKRLQDTISEHYYPCTSEILRGLGMMYAQDNRFTQTIDQVAGAGTAQFVYEAIEESLS
ncbi:MULTISPECIES: MerR family transcriptional regulator [unclassified Streptococcus]|uniref:MerR family transcriptional regulator n=1 Tax=unclassified Streptococcus TaxID=2608887 RepID=UPI00359D856F